MRGRHHVRRVLNVVNLSTPVGRVVAAVGGARPRRGRDGLLIAHGYRLPVPAAAAFTVGNVVVLRAAITRGRDPIGSVPVALLQHEERHATQYALCGGILMPVLYLGAAGWSWMRAGDHYTRNVFERRAGLADGGYRPPLPPAQIPHAMGGSLWPSAGSGNVEVGEARRPRPR
jgi:hypothetical protein